jgi:hypothetical protein
MIEAGFGGDFVMVDFMASFRRGRVPSLPPTWLP